MTAGDKAPVAIDRWIQTASVLIGFIALVVTVYFSVKADKLKELAVSYQSKQALVSIENAHAKSGIEVRLAGNSVGAPWIVSGRVENSGNTPIEERDIESPLRLTFEGGKLLSADLGGKRNADIYARSEVQGNTFIIHHKLLNPGDWIGFDLVFDGEPKIPATLAVRISGVEAGLQRVNEREKYQSHLSIVAIPRPAFIMALTLMSSLFIFLLLGGVLGIWNSVSCIFNRPRRSLFSKRISRASVPELLEGFIPKTRRSRIIWPFLEPPSTAEQVDDVVSFEQHVERLVPQAIRDEIVGSPKEAAEEIRSQLRAHIQDALSSRLYIVLPNGLDQYHRSAFRAKDFSNMSVDQMIEIATKTAVDPTSEAPWQKRYDPQDLVLGIGCFTLSVAAFFVLGGAWRTFLST